MRDYTCPGPWGFIARAAQRNFVIWGWGLPPSSSPWVPLGTTHCSSSRGLSARARDLALGPVMCMGVTGPWALPVRVEVDENPNVGDVDGLLSAA